MKRSVVVAVVMLLVALALTGCSLLNQTPTAEISASQISGKAPLEVTFLAKAIDDGTIVRYEWNFGDGAEAVGRSVQHIYKTMGVYTASLCVTDDGGKTGTASQTINVLNPGPLCDGVNVKNFTGNACVPPFCAGDVLGFSPQNARHPEGKEIVTYKWDFGDGTVKYGSTVKHQFAVGVWNVILTLVDSEGVSNSYHKKIAIQQCCSCLPEIFIEKVKGDLFVGNKITLRGNWENACCACSEETSEQTLKTLSLIDSQGICPEPAPPCNPCPSPCPNPCYNGKWEWRIYYGGDLIRSESDRYVTFVPCCAGDYKVFLYYTCSGKSTYTSKTFTIE